MQQRVLLIQPREGQKNVTRLLCRPLALEMLASRLTTAEVDIYDMRVDDLALEAKLSQFNPTLVGITCPFTVTVPSVLNLIREISRLRPQTCIIVGGVHPSLVPEDFTGTGVHAIVRGPGETTLERMVAVREQGGSWRDIPNLYVKEHGEFVFTGEDAAAFGFGHSSLPARALTTKYLERYTRTPRGQTVSISVTSRGCPYRCNFCAAWKVQGGRFLCREIEDVVTEIKQTGEEVIYFFDDNALARIPRMRQLAARLKAEKVTKEYQMWASADAIARNEDLIREWAEIGLKRLFVGFESWRDEELREYGKKASVSTNEAAHRLLKKHGIELSPTFIVRPDFTADDFRQLHAYLLGNQYFMPYPVLYTPLPGTELWEQHKHELLTRDYECYDLFHLTLPPRHMDAAEFMSRFIALYLENPSWQMMAQRSPVVSQMLDGIRSLAAPLR